YVVFGKANFGPTFNLADIPGGNGSLGFRIDGISAEDQSGSAVAAAGDFNNDGFDDILVAAYMADPGGKGSAGQAYLIFGKATFSSGSLALSSLNGTSGFRIAGLNVGDELGYSIAGGGDHNGDGIDDILVGAWRASPDS